MTLKIQTEVSN